MLIDASYFVGELNIPNTDDLSVLSELTSFINKYEVNFMREALGMDLYRAFMNALGQTSAGYLNVTEGKANEDIDQKWKDLLNGKEYIGLDVRLHKWIGFVSVADDVSGKKSPIANYVYYWWMRSHATQSTGVSEVVANADNAVNVSVAEKASRAWNEMVEWIHDLIWFMDYSSSFADYNYYPGWWLQNRYRLLKTFRPINAFSI